MAFSVFYNEHFIISVIILLFFHTETIINVHGTCLHQISSALQVISTFLCKLPENVCIIMPII